MAENTFEILTIKDIMAAGPPTDVSEFKAHAAHNLSMPPLYHGAEDDPYLDRPSLGKVIWHGRQWAVTDYGLECLCFRYDIEKERLWEKEKEHGWMDHMGEKNWVDVADFAEALRIARHTHKDGRGG